MDSGQDVLHRNQGLVFPIKLLQPPQIFDLEMPFNLEMVKAGLAEVYRGTPAKGQNMEPYWKAEGEAKKAGKGMWVLGDKYVSPREWRKTHGN
jgi:hypothetical protein